MSITSFSSRVLKDSSSSRSKVEATPNKGEVVKSKRNLTISSYNKGAINGGITKSISPILTQSSRKLKLKEEIGTLGIKIVGDGPRAFRDQKALDQGKK